MTSEMCHFPYRKPDTYIHHSLCRAWFDAGLSAVPYRCIWAARLFKHSSSHTETEGETCEWDHWVGSAIMLLCFEHDHSRRSHPSSWDTAQIMGPFHAINMHINWQEFLKNIWNTTCTCHHISTINSSTFRVGYIPKSSNCAQEWQVKRWYYSVPQRAFYRVGQASNTQRVSNNNSSEISVIMTRLQQIR